MILIDFYEISFFYKSIQIAQQQQYQFIFSQDFYSQFNTIKPMSPSFSQIRAILWKNFLISFRTKQFVRELISTIILGAFLIIIESNSSNNIISPFYLSMAVIGYGRSVGFMWSQEKQSYQKQMQIIMGISFIGYLAAWLLYFILNAIYVWAVMILMLYFGVIKVNGLNFEDGYSFQYLAILYFVYTLSTISFALFLSTFFRKAKIAAQAMVFIQLVLNFFYFLRFSQSYRQSRVLLLLTSIFPQVSFNNGVCSIAFISNFPKMNFYYSDSMISLCLSTVIYLLLALYLEQVLPSSQGVKKHPLFFIKNLFRSDVAIDQNEPLLQQIQEIQQNQIQYFQQRQHSQTPMIQLYKIFKKFGNKTAVNNLSLNFYANQIFCLLGHNGAGKSTTINLLTGLLSPTSGKFKVLGLDFENNIDEIRKNIGLCLQFNVLYEDLTIEQHLQFYARLKQIQVSHIHQNVQEIIQSCSLINEKGKFVKNLSGGNKRKLSLANALIGKSKIIFLDEPSSGLDPNSRQGIWSIIKSVRTPERSLILTTHHLQQAQELSQVIGIMSNGKMKIVGQSQYIKQKFNVGYHIILNFTQANKAMASQCKKIILQNIKGAKQDEQTAYNTLKFLLPTLEIKKFPKLFESLQKICSLSVNMSTLQDAFVKLEEENEDIQLSNNNDIQIKLPDHQCSYSYKRQFKAVFNRKLKTTMKSFGAIVSIMLPIIFISLGVLMSCVLIEGDSDIQQWIRLYLMSFFFVWAFIFNTSTFCGDLVLEREKRFKYLSHVLGLRKLPYWSANYAFDLLIFTIPLILFFIMIFAIGQKAKFLTDVSGYLVILFALFSFSFIGYSYLFSFMFQKSSTAFRLFPFFNMIFFYTIPTIPMNTWPDGALAQYICPMISPFIAFFNSFFTQQIMGKYANFNQFKSKYFYYNLLCLVIQSIVFIVAALYIQSLRFRLKDRQSLNHQNDDVIQQRGSFYDQQHINDNNQIYISHLYKKYSNGFLAIKDNSFSVKKGQIFGLLGPNGAGKSTTFNIVTAALAKTSGTVKILGQNIQNGIMDIFTQFGVCPQYDSLYQNLTTQEHLIYAARLKGIKQQQISSLIQFYANLLSLTPYIHVKSQNLSGGNKRKLAVSMSMLANPRIMFFDQPSSGVDPISRRFLWKSLTLSSQTKNAAMVLTTHTMNEAESLCSRIGILIKGKFVTVASPSQLKLKYGKGFRIQVKYFQNKQSQLIDEIKQIFGQVQIEKSENRIILFTIQNSQFSYNKAYDLFENKLCNKGIVQKYKIKQSTLQQAFLFLSQFQPIVQPIQYSQPWQFCCWQKGANGCQWI